MPSRSMGEMSHTAVQNSEVRQWTDARIVLFFHSLFHLRLVVCMEVGCPLFHDRIHPFTPITAVVAYGLGQCFAL